MELFTYLGKSMIILSLFYGVYFLWLRKDTLFTAKRHFFLGGILAALLLPFLEFTKVIYKEITVAAPIPIAEMTPISSTELLAPVQETTAINGWQLAIAIYLLVVLFMMGQLLFQFFSLLKLLRSHPSEKRGSYTFIQVPDAISPFSFFKYIVYNPNAHTAEELEMILRHEQVHALQWHSIDLLLAHLLRAFQWINPFAWWYKKSLEENLEFIADNETVAQVASKKQYQLTLVKASSSLSAPALTTQFYQSFIKKRIIMLNKSTSKKHNLWKLCIVLPALAFFLWSFNVKEEIQYTEVSLASEELKINNNKDALVKEKALQKNAIAVISEEPSLEKATEATSTTPMQPPSLEPTETKEHKTASTTLGINTPFTVKTQPSIATQNSLNEYRVKITKNTTNSELENMKKELQKEHGIDMSYDVVRNEQMEIIEISLSYTDRSGNSGSYSVNDDEKPIEEFFFYMKENGDRGFWSEAHEKRMEKRMAEREMRLAKRMEEREERNIEMTERKEKMQKRLEKQRVKMKERQEKMRDRMEDRRERMEEVEVQEDIEEHTEGTHTVVRSGGGNYASYSSGSNPENKIVIEANTTDSELAALKSSLAAKGITFKYSRVRRNSQGEITGIKVVTSNGKGSQSSMSTTTDSGKPIDAIVIEM